MIHFVGTDNIGCSVKLSKWFFSVFTKMNLCTYGYQVTKFGHIKQAVGGQLPRYTPPLPSPVGAQALARSQAHRNVAVISHAEYVPMLTAAATWRVKAAVSKAAWWPWPLTLKVVSKSPVTWTIPVPILICIGLSVLQLGRCTRQTDRHQTKALLNAPPIRGGA